MTERDIFLGALDIPDSAARAAYLDGACGSDTTLRGRVEALLRSHEEAGSFLNLPALTSSDSGAAPTRAFDSSAADPGDGPTRTEGGGADDETDDALAFLAPAQRPDSLGRIDHYEVLEVLGRGGFGVVFRAFDEVLQRVVAVKVLAPSMAVTSPARKRFLREALSAARVEHENVVRIHETGEQPLPYLVMEFVAGETLQQKLDRTGPLEAAEALKLGRQIAEGLAAAHAQGLIHRDIKPSNILIESAAGERAKITDFGLARAADDASLTRSGTVAGTPMYMAPEQAKGETLDHRADLFSLGSVLYAMLTGRPPFRAETTLAVLKRVAEDTPRPIREVIPEVPEWLCRIVEKLHAKNPADRFQTAREVADLLADCERQLQAHGELRDYARIPGGKPTARASGRWAQLELLIATVGVAAAVAAATLFKAAWPFVLVLIVLFGISITTFIPLRGAATRGRLSAAPGSRRRQWKWAAVALGLCLVAAAAWYGPYALRYSANRAEVEFPAHPDVLRYTVTRLGEPGQPRVVVDPDRPFRLEPGEYRVSAVLRDGYVLDHWEVTVDSGFRGLTGERTHPRGGETFVLGVNRGERFTVRPVTDDLATVEKRNRDAVNNNLGQIAKAVHDFDGWEALFDGKNLTGLVEVPKQPGSGKIWDAVDDVLVVKGEPAGYLRTQKQYGDFHLSLELRMPASAGGLGLYGAILWGLGDAPVLPPNAPVTSHINLLLAKQQPKMEPFVVYNLGAFNGAPHQADLPLDESPAGQWSKLEIISRGGALEIRTNGNKHTFPNNRPVRGYVALQSLGGGIQFRNIRIKELPPSSPPVPKKAAEVAAFLVGSWKSETEVLMPKVPPEVAKSTGITTNELIAGGKFMRSYGSYADGHVEALMVKQYDAGTDTIRGWFFTSSGEFTGPGVGRWNADNHTLLWMEKLPSGLQSVHQFDFVDGNTIKTRMYYQNDKSEIVFEVRQTLTRLPAPVDVPRMPPDPKRPPEAALLDKLVGEWQTTGTIKTKDDPAGTPFASRVRSRSALGGRVIESWESELPGHDDAYWLTAYDTGMKAYRFWMFNAAGEVMSLGGGWDEKAQTLKWNAAGPDGSNSSATWLWRSPDVREWTTVIKDAVGKPALDISAVSVRAPAAPPLAVAPFDAAKAKEHQEAWAKHLGVKGEYENSINMKFRLIPPGEFTMGSSDEEIKTLSADAKKRDLADWTIEQLNGEAPRRRAVVEKPFYLGTHEVTVADFRKFVAAAKYTTDGEKSGDGGWAGFEGKWVRRPEHVWKTPGAWVVTDREPVTQVSWNDAQAFCAWLGEKEGLRYALPEEVQWEFAARAGTTKLYGASDLAASLDPFAWTRDNLPPNRSGRPQPVGLKSANAFGLHDMFGNAWEWCAEWQPGSGSKHRVLRGGGWHSDPLRARPANRSGGEPNKAWDAGVGFRVAIVGDLKPKPLTDKQRLQGAWVGETAERNGAAVPKDQAEQIRVTFDGGKIHIAMPGGKAEEGTFKLDPEVNPKQIDCSGTDQKTRYGIYRFLDAGRLEICMGEEKDRPKEFNSAGGPTRMRITLRRAPAGGAFVPLFNGKDLTGWKVPKDAAGAWKVEGDLLVGRGPGFLFSERADYRDFHYRIEAKVVAGWSQQLFRHTSGEEPRYGYKAYMHTYDWEAKAGSVATRWKGDGGAGTFLQQVKEKVIARDTWFTQEVIVRGPRITVILNGEQVADVLCKPGDAHHHALGCVGLEVSKDSHIEVRKIEIKELPPEPEAGPPAKKDEPNPAAVQAMKELVAARAKTRDEVKARFEAGKANKIELMSAEAELTEAFVKLAEEEHQPAAVVQMLEALVKQRQEERDLIAVRVKVGTDAPAIVNAADARLADAKTRLAKAKPPAPEAAPAPRPAPKFLRRFDPAKDETITRGQQDMTGWLFTIKSAREERTLRLYEIANPQMDAGGVLVFRAKMSTYAARAYPVIVCRFPDGTETRSAVPQIVAEGSTNEVAYEVRCPLKPGARPDLIRLNLVLKGEEDGHAFFKEMELWQLPTEQLHGRLAAPVTLPRKFDPAREGSVTFTKTQDASGWFFEVKPGREAIRLFELENPVLDEAAPLVLRGTLGTNGVKGAYLQIVCCFSDGTETVSNVPEVIAEGNTNPTPYEVRHALKKGEKPYLIRVNVVLKKSDKDQSVYLKELELSQAPAAGPK